MLTYWDGIVLITALWIVCNTRITFRRFDTKDPEDEDP